MNYSIIIPNYNGSNYLYDCLNSILKSINITKNSEFEIILVDNGSTDDSIEKFNSILNNEDNFTKKVIKLNKNFGFAFAVNKGIDKAKYEWIILFNNDLIIDKNWLNIIDKNINTSYKVYCGTVLDKNGQYYESTGLDFSYSGRCLNINNKKIFENNKLIKNNYKEIWGSSAALVVYNKKIIQEIGMFDNDFFAYEEDVDLALRLNKFKYKTLYIPQAISYHIGGGTSNKMLGFRAYHDTKNWHYIIIKNFSFQQILSNLPRILIERLKNIKYLIKSTPFPNKIYIVFILYLEILKNIPKMIKKRNKLNKLLKYNS